MYSPELNKILVSRAEAPGCLYDLSRPDEAIEAGQLLELVDFQNSARSIGSLASLGTRVFKEAVQSLSLGDEAFKVQSDHNEQTTNPFAHVWRLPGSPNGLTVWTTPNIHMCLQNFYIQTQALKDYYDGLTDEQRLYVFAKKGSLLVRDVIYDEGEVIDLGQLVSD